MFESKMVYKIRGIIFDIYNHVVGAWAEEKYEEILFDALAAAGLQVERQPEFSVIYKEHQVGLFRPDLIVEKKIILELKVVPEIFPLHQAQTISYLKVTGLPLAMLVNFGGKKIFLQTYPNKLQQIKTLNTNFDIDKIKLNEEDKKLVKPFLEMSQEILETLGLGYFHQVYRRAFWDELKRNNIDFEWINKLELKYGEKVYDTKDVRFFRIEKLLISIVAVKALDKLTIAKFSKFIKYYNCKKGLIINFNSTVVDFDLTTGIHDLQEFL